MLIACGLAVSLFALGCAGSSKLSISCDEFLAKSETEQSDIARSFGSKSLFRDDDPAADAVIPGIRGYQASLVTYCADSEHGDDRLTELDTEVSFKP